MGINLKQASHDSWDIVLHEYGHFVADQFDIYPNVAMNHSLTDNLISYISNDTSLMTLSGNPKRDGCKLAWQEGWAHYFSISAQIHQGANLLGINGVGNTSFEGYGIEISNTTDNKWSKGEGHEFAVARALWDMADVQNSTYEATDDDPINFGFLKMWNCSINSSAQTFSDFMEYIYARHAKTSHAYLNVGSILADHKISADIITMPTTQTSGYLSLRPAYSDIYVSNTYYLEIYNLNMQKIREFNIGTTGYYYEINAETWSSLCSQYSSGFYIAIRTVPDSTDYATGPYYSNVELFVP